MQPVLVHMFAEQSRIRRLDYMQTTDYAGYIRRAFMDEGLQGIVAKMPLERNFKLDHVKEVHILAGWP